MGLEVVLKEIEESNKKEIELINLDAFKTSEDIVENARKQVRETLGLKLANIEDQIQKKKQQVISSANLEVKRLILNKKKELLDSVYSNAFEYINSMSDEKNKELLECLIKKYCIDNNSNIYSNLKSEKLVKELSTLNYTGNVNCIGGIIIEDKNGNIKQDYTYDLILKNVFERSLKSISDIFNW